MIVINNLLHIWTDQIIPLFPGYTLLLFTRLSVLLSDFYLTHRNWAVFETSLAQIRVLSKQLKLENIPECSDVSLCFIEVILNMR